VKGVSIVLITLLVIWMGWITLEVRQMHMLLLETCGGVYAGPAPLHKYMPGNCPAFTMDEVTPREKSN
jgi:hypothetical protein